MTYGDDSARLLVVAAAVFFNYPSHLGLVALGATGAGATCTGAYFPAEGDTLAVQSQKTPAQVGLKAAITTALNNTIKSYPAGTGYAATIGALIQIGKITADQTLSHHVKNVWNAQPSTVPAGNCDLNATLKQGLVQTSGYSDPAKCPGQEWHYSEGEMERR